MRLNTYLSAIALGALLCATPFAVADTALDSSVKKLVSALPCKYEHLPARTVVMQRYTKANAADAFVFFTTECGNNATFYLAIFQSNTADYKHIAHAAIGGVPLSAYGIDFGYVRVEGGAFFLRAERDEDPKYGDLSTYPKVYYKWRLSNGKLTGSEQPYYLTQDKFRPIPPVPAK